MRRSQGDGQGGEQRDERLTAYVLGELSRAEAAEVEARLLVDEEAAAEVESIRGVVGMLAGALGKEELPVLGDERRELLLAGPAPMRMGWGWRVRVAAALVVATAGVVVSQQMIGRVGGRSGVERVVNSDVRPEVVLEQPDAVARRPEHRNGAFRFVGEGVPMALADGDGAIAEVGSEPVVLSLHTTPVDAGEVWMVSLPRLVEDIEVRTPLREQYKTGAVPDGPGGVVNTNVFRF